ncbi:hypothetical protein [Microbacterium flavum]|uniref:Uncharacterized protein n=1 Tax=Microbacterium flavum TaxID=415216 RepID=A0ABS5XUV0_9MICO|nr:hypothetical protein [Microbacterium flavum]MBT8798313.1 hypothetical protein [Microbacterium flavum]
MVHDETGATVVGITPAILALYVSQLKARLERGDVSAAAVAESFSSTGAFRRLGAWLKAHGASLGLVLAALSLLADGLQVAGQLTPQPTISPEQVEEIISSVIEEVRINPSEPSHATEIPTPTTH